MHGAAPVSPLPFAQARPDPLPKGKDAPRVCVIGGGGTGAALAYDLSLRGLSVVLLERGELTSGTTGRHHGQLHCGARYALGDRLIARECMVESLALRVLVPEAIEYNGGLFVSSTEEGASLEADFVAACRDAGIPARSLSPREALELEPGLDPRILAAVWVPDGSFDAFRLPLSFFAAAKALGADIRPWNEVVAFEVSKGRAMAATVLDRLSRPNREYRIEADCFVSATGAWAGRVGSLAGLDVSVTPAPGAMLAFEGRFADHVVSRLGRPGDGDILVPQRGLSIIGSTQRVTDDPDSLLPSPEELDFLRARAAELLPALKGAPERAAWCAARPLAARAHGGRTGAAGGSDGEGRSISRDFAAIDHARDGVEGFYSLIGGKATVLRAMAEKGADLVCRSLGFGSACRTKVFALPSWRDFYSTDGGKARWAK